MVVNIRAVIVARNDKLNVRNSYGTYNTNLVKKIWRGIAQTVAHILIHWQPLYHGSSFSGCFPCFCGYHTSHIRYKYRPTSIHRQGYILVTKLSNDKLKTISYVYVLLLDTTNLKLNTEIQNFSYKWIFYVITQLYKTLIHLPSL